MKNGLGRLNQSLDAARSSIAPMRFVSFQELHDIMGMHEIEEMEQRFLTPEQLETKYGRERKASIMPDAKPTKPAKPATKSKQTA